MPDAAALRVLREGAPIGAGETTRPARVRGLGSARGGTWLEIVLTEGKNRQVRRMCAAVGHEVTDLVRVRDRPAAPGIAGGRPLAAPHRGRGRGPRRARVIASRPFIPEEA